MARGPEAGRVRHRRPAGSRCTTASSVPKARNFDVNNQFNMLPAFFQVVDKGQQAEEMAPADSPASVRIDDL